MRIILKLGGFHQEIRIPDEKAFQPITIPHPLGLDSTSMFNIDEEHHTVDLQNLPSRKWMIFEYRKQLDHDLLEYEFVKES